MPSPSTPTDWRTYWDQRYSDKPARYGFEANVFVMRELSDMPPSRVLDAGCGTGRNAVWMAARGHSVTGIDISPVAIEQARSLAASRNIDVGFAVADLLEWEPMGQEFDLVLLSYIQLHPPLRTEVHRRLQTGLGRDGAVFVVAHHADNLDRGVGGPQYREVLYTESDLSEDFRVLDVIRNERIERSIPSDPTGARAIDILFIGRRKPEPS
jgi:SAM-dependent methyltransferase